MLDEVRVPVEALHVQDYKKVRDLIFGLPTDIIASLVTAHGRSMGIFGQNEKIVINTISADRDYAEIDGSIFKQESH